MDFFQFRLFIAGIETKILFSLSDINAQPCLFNIIQVQAAFFLQKTFTEYKFIINKMEKTYNKDKKIEKVMILTNLNLS